MQYREEIVLPDLEMHGTVSGLAHTDTVRCCALVRWAKNMPEKKVVRGPLACIVVLFPVSKLPHKCREGCFVDKRRSLRVHFVEQKTHVNALRGHSAVYLFAGDSGT